ncbi:S-layer homology domain-containing protein [Paenibacillus chungangensis]|uniref:S-layer homology domain-containing protein n=1 Tax=Paenibacillus chungangensis TaxID=696535 RepID=A0ABW3HUV7_9BACL
MVKISNYQSVQKIIVLALTVCIFIGMMPGQSTQVIAATDTWNGTVASSYDGGAGTSVDPYRIATGAQLAYLASQVNTGTDYSGKHFKLTADIDLNNNEWTPIGGKYSATNRSFTGMFDGDGHVIRNMTITTAETHWVGLFGIVGDATIKNLGVEYVQISNPATNGRTGGLVGYNWGYPVTIINSYTTGSITAGQMGQSIITLRVGGLVGYSTVNNASVTNSYSTVNVTVNGNGGRAGGLVGRTGGNGLEAVKISNSYATGTVTANGTGNYTGGLVGFQNEGVIDNSYWNSDKASTGVGYVTDYSGTSKTDAEMKAAAFVTLLNQNRGPDAEWISDSGSVNGGYPTLSNIGAGRITVQDSTVNPTIATFDKYDQAATYSDMTIAITPNGNTFIDVLRSGTGIGAGNYSFNDPSHVLTIKKEYLATLGTGAQVFTIDMSAGMDPTWTVTISDSTPLQASGLTVSANDVTGSEADGKTVIDVAETAGAEHKFVYKNFEESSVSVPNVGDTLTGYVDLPADGIIEAANGDIIAIAEIDADGKVVKFGTTVAAVVIEHAVIYAEGAHGSASSASEVVVDGQSPSHVPTIIPDSGYTFAGWSSDGGTTLLHTANVEASTVTADILYTAYYSANAYTASNSLSANSTTIPLGVGIALSATGDRQSAIGAVVGDEQYIPISWVSTETGKQGLFTESTGSYTSTYAPSEVGTYTVTATFQKKVWDGDSWGNATGETDTKTIQVIVENVPITVTPEAAITLPTQLYMAYNNTTVYEQITISKPNGTTISNVTALLGDGEQSKFIVGTLNKDSFMHATSNSITLLVKPKNALPIGTYTETLTIAGDDAISDMIDLSFTVDPHPDGTILLLPADSYNFDTAGTYYEGYSAIPKLQLSLQKVGHTFSNVPNVQVSFGKGIESPFTIGSVPSGTLAPGVASSTALIGVKLNLPAGVYHDTLTVTADGGVSESIDLSVTIHELVQADAPTADIADGMIISNNSKVTLSSSTAGATIYYTLDGSIPTTGSLSGTNVTVSAAPGHSVTIMAIAVKDGMADSEIATFTYTIVNLPDAPANPQNLVAASGNRQIDLGWNTVTGATYYNLYMSTTPGQFDVMPMATVTEATYQVDNLTNGTVYYFVVKAGNDGGLSGNSNQVGATPATIPFPITHVSAVAGNGSAIITFTAPADNGGSAITEYEVTASSGNIVVTGMSSPITITGLTNGTTYTFTVKSINSQGKSAQSAVSNEVIPSAPSSHEDDTSDSPSQPTLPAGPELTAVDVLVNGKRENAGTAMKEKVNGQEVMTIVVDEEKLHQRLEAEGKGAVIAIFDSSGSDVVIGQLNGRIIKKMEMKQAVVEIRTDQATYTLPADQINIDAISKQFGTAIQLQDIKVKIEIATPLSNTIQMVEDTTNREGFTLVAPPIQFKITVVYGDRTAEVTKFNAYVKRTVVIPEGVDPSRITTGVVIEPDGTVRHVPTKIIEMDGVFYAQINSLTNSIYSVVWHPREFHDMKNHWAKDAVNNMASRLIVSGIGNEMFSPNREITRAEFAAIIVRGLGLGLESGESVFTDVKVTDWYSSAIQTAYEYELISGYDDGTFRPNEKITREQAMLIIANAMKITGLKDNLAKESKDAALQAFEDKAQISAWSIAGVVDTILAGVVSGRSPNHLAPQDFITRAEVATIMERILEKSDLI